MKTASHPVIGFVILTWNSERVIEKCIKAIIGLNRITCKAVIVDNGSKDKTLDILKKYEREYPDQLGIVSYEYNRGTTVSRNDGLKRLMQLNPDYYCILDSDTEINDTALLMMLHELEIHDEYGLIGPCMADSKGVVQMSARAFPTGIEKIYKAIPIKALQSKGEKMEVQNPPSPGMPSYPVDYLMSACWLIKPVVLNEAGLLDEKIFYAPEDAEYCIRVWKAGFQVAYCPGAHIIHEWQRLSKKKLISKMNWEHIKGLLYMFFKHRYFSNSTKLRRKI